MDRSTVSDSLRAVHCGSILPRQSPLSLIRVNLERFLFTPEPLTVPPPAAAHHTPEASPVPAFGGDLFDLAHLPLEHVLASAAIAGDGRIHPVGHIDSKAQAAHSQGVRFVAVSSHQTDDSRDSPLGQSCQSLSVVKADSLTELLGALHHKLRDDLFGPIVQLPDVLRHTQANAQHRPTSHDYRAESFEPFEWLERQIGAAIRSHSDPFYLVV